MTKSIIFILISVAVSFSMFAQQQQMYTQFMYNKMGLNAAYAGNESYMNARRNTSQDLYRNSVFNSEYIRKYFVFNAPEDWQNNYQRWQQYDLGAMFVEVLTAIKGPDATMQMWKLAKDGIKFEEAFETVYGTPYSKALPIMAKAIALQLGRN